MISFFKNRRKISGGFFFAILYFDVLKFKLRADFAKSK